MERNNYGKKTITLVDNLQTLADLHSLEKIGAGHDGIVYRYGNKAIKELKYDIETRKKLSLMTFEKAQSFVKYSNDFKRLIVPQAIFLDENGSFCAYLMNYIDKIDFTKYPFNTITLSTFLNAIYDLWDDFNLLNKMQIIANDINPSSYLLDNNFLHLCDTDKYIMRTSNTTIYNREKFNYMIAKLLYLLMYDKNIGIENLKSLNNWVRKQANNQSFLKKLTEELTPIFNETLPEYTTYLKRKLTK